MKYLITLFFTMNLLNASLLLDKSTPICIEDYYYQNGILYYQASSNSLWYSTSFNYLQSNIYNNFNYDNLNNKCIKSGLNDLGLLPEQYNFLLALCGLIVGGVFLFFTVDAFKSVGGKR